MERAQHEHRAQPARHHPPEEGNEQAGSNSLQLGGESAPHATSVPCTLQLIKPITEAKPSTQRVIMPARDPPLGDGHKQAEHAMGQEQPGLPIKNQHKNSVDREILQKHEKAPALLHARRENARIRHQRLAQTAQHHPLEDAYEQAGSSSLQLRRKPTPHATFAPCTLQPTQTITNEKPRLLRKIGPGGEQAKQGIGQKQLGLTMENQQKNPADSARQQENGNTPTTLQLTHDPTKNAKLSSQGMTWAVRDPPLGEGHEQPDTNTEEQGIWKVQPRPAENFSTELVLPQKLGSAGFKIPTHKRASDQPGALYAASNMGGHEMASSIIIVRGRHPTPTAGPYDPCHATDTAVAK